MAGGRNSQKTDLNTKVGINVLVEPSLATMIGRAISSCQSETEVSNHETSEIYKAAHAYAAALGSVISESGPIRRLVPDKPTQ